MRPIYHQPDLRNHTNSAALDTSMIADDLPELVFAGCPSSDGSGTFMPNRPVITVSGPNSAAMTGQHLRDVGQPVRDASPGAHRARR